MSLSRLQVHKNIIWAHWMKVGHDERLDELQERRRNISLSRDCSGRSLHQNQMNSATPERALLETYAAALEDAANS